jgi:signal transduction histidine kinase/CheY-like chemotaxis protein
MTLRDDDIEVRIQAEKLETLSRLMDASNILGAVVAVIMAFSASPTVRQRVWLWLYIYVAITALRVVWSYWVRSRDRSPAEYHQLRHAMVAILFTSGLMWGLFGFMTFDPSDAGHTLFIATVQTGLGAHALACLSVYMPAFIGFCLPIIISFVVPRLMAGTSEHLVISFMAVGFTAFIYFAGRNSERGRDQSIRLRYNNERLIEDLRQSNEKAEAASRAKSEFLAVISHEIRTPMNGIGAMAELLANAPLADEYQNMVAIIRQSADGLLGILGDLIDYSKIEAGKLSIETSTFDLRDLAENVLQILALSAEDKGLDLVLNMAADSPEEIHGDPARLRQILFNLVSNAVKFTESGHVLLRVQRGPGELHFAVTDTGPGIALELQNKLFHPFTQADSSAMRRFGGSGLGLSICKRLVELMGGRIALSSAPGSGTTVTFAIPVDAPPETGSARPLDGIRVHFSGPSPRREAIDNLLIAHGATVTETMGDAELVVWEGEPPPCACPTVELVSFHRDVGEGGLRDTAVRKPVKAADLVAAILGQLKRRPAPTATAAMLPTFTPPTRATAEAEKAIILLVEDQVVNRLVIVKMIERLGYLCDVAEDGFEALKRFKENAYYGLVLTDLHMPRMDGIALAQAIRRDLASTVPIVAVTADALPATVLRCNEAAFNGYLTKPLTLRGLRETIGFWLSAKEAAPAN